MTDKTELSNFNPLSISGCVLWLDANDPAGNGSQPADGSVISTWVDKSGVCSRNKKLRFRILNFIKRLFFKEQAK